METRRRLGLLLIFSMVASLGLVSFVSCILAESHKPKKGDIKLDDKLCYLPESRAFRCGIAALGCLVIGQIIGNSVICCGFCSGENGNSFKAKGPTIATAFLVLSWISFVVAVILLSTATSMSKTQPYGQGWVDHECYLVKDGVYTGSGVLALLTTAGTLGSAFLKIRKAQVRKIHAQVG